MFAPAIVANTVVDGSRQRLHQKLVQYVQAVTAFRYRLARNPAIRVDVHIRTVKQPADSELVIRSYINWLL